MRVYAAFLLDGGALEARRVAVPQPLVLGRQQVLLLEPLPRVEPAGRSAPQLQHCTAGGQHPAVRVTAVPLTHSTDHHT